jgi:hypothetical protein
MSVESWFAAGVLGWVAFVTVWPFVLNYGTSLRFRLNSDTHDLIRDELDSLRERVRLLEACLLGLPCDEEPDA